MRRGECSRPMLHVGEILANAARVAPDAVAATLDDDALDVRRDRRGRRTGSRTGCARRGVGRGDRVLWWGDTSLEAVPVFAALAKIGAVFAPLNARASRRRGRARSPSTRGRGCCSPARRTPTPARELAAAAGIPLLGARSRRPRAATRRGRRARRARPARHLLHERQHRAAQGCRALAPRELAAHVRRRDHARPGGGGTVCMFPLFHMAGWTIALGAWQARRAVHFVRVPDAATLLRDHRAPPRGAALLHPGGVGAHPRARRRRATTSRRSSKPTPARRRRRPSCCRDQGRAPPHRDARVLRLDRGGPGLQLADADLFRKPGSVGVAQPGVEVRLDERGEVCLRSPFLMDGYFDDPDATAEALRRRLVPHRRPRRARRRGLPLDRRPGARRDPHRRRDGRAARGRSGARPSIPASPRSRWSACPTPSGARS